MCGRYLFTPQEIASLKRIYELALAAGKNVKTGEVFPSDTTAVIVAQDQKVAVSGMPWGFPGFKGSQLIINARSESVNHKLFFKQAFKETRCVFPMTGFYEWNRQKSKFLFTLSQNPVFVCGFYRYFTIGERSIILTTAANDSVSPIHDRMPLLLPKKLIKTYLMDSDFATNYLTASMPALAIHDF